MAKKAKGNRVQVILECTEMKESGLPGTSRYVTTKNRKNTPERYGKENSGHSSVWQDRWPFLHKSYQDG